jgi:hypothetical protein
VGEDSVKGNYSLNTFPVSLPTYIKLIIIVEFEVLTAVVMEGSVLWDITPRSSVDFHRTARRYIPEDRNTCYYSLLFQLL